MRLSYLLEDSKTLKIAKKDKLNYEKIKEGIREIEEDPYRSNIMKQYLKGTRKIRNEIIE